MIVRKRIFSSVFERIRIGKRVYSFVLIRTCLFVCAYSYVLIRACALLVLIEQHVYCVISSYLFINRPYIKRNRS